MSKDYDIDTIISIDDFKKNQERILKSEKSKKLKLRRWVKNVLWMILGALMAIVIYQMFTIETTYETSNGYTYTCRGGIIEICAGN